MANNCVTNWFLSYCELPITEFSGQVNLSIYVEICWHLITDTWLLNSYNYSNYIFISSIAAATPRFKNYIYGLSKYKLEESIKNINLPSYLIIRFGKVKTKMSEGHKNPPFTISTHKASEFILDNLNKSGYIYTNAALKTIAAILKLLPSWMIKALKY